MSSSDREAHARGLDRVRRCVEAATAGYVNEVVRSGDHLLDGHRSISAWGQAACNWSAGEAARLARLGRAMHRLPKFGAAATAGQIGVAHMHAVAGLVANPRIDAHLDGSEALIVEQATTLEFDDLVTFLQHWVALADQDGAYRAHERAHANRRARIDLHDGQAWLQATGGAAQGAVMREILDRFRQAEFKAEWADGVHQHGESMRASLMERTDTQRAFDALVAVFGAAAANNTDTADGADGAEVVVNILIDQATFEHALTRATGSTPPPADPSSAQDRHCETDRGEVLNPFDVLTAAMTGHVRRIVIDGAGVVINFGRRRRLFTGPLRQAVLLAERRCLWPGCNRPSSHCQADHTLPFNTDGPTQADNAGPLCAHHNRWKTRGYRTWRDPNGHWHTQRPDNTVIGWRIQEIDLAA